MLSTAAAQTGNLRGDKESLRESCPGRSRIDREARQGNAARKNSKKIQQEKAAKHRPAPEEAAP
jgi:hypothetical protein